MPTSTHSLSFDGGANAYTANAAFPTTTGDFTATGWFKKAGAGTKIWMAHTGGGGGWRVQSGGDKLGLSIENVNDFPFSSLAYTTGTWHFFAIVVTGSTSAKGFLKPSGGSLSDQTITMAAVAGSPIVFSLASSMFDGAFTFDGLLDDVRVYGSSLSDADVTTLSNGGDVSGAVGYWAMEEGSGTTTADGAGSATLTLQSGIGWSSDVPAELAGGGGGFTAAAAGWYYRTAHAGVGNF